MYSPSLEPFKYGTKLPIKLTDAIVKIEGMLMQSNLTWDIEYRPNDNYYVIRIGEKKDGE